MDDLENIIRRIFVAIISIWIFIIIGKQFHWFDWVGPTLKVVWFIIKIILGIALVVGVIWFVYYIKNKPKIEKEKQEKINLGRKRKKKLPIVKRYSDYELGKMSEEEFQQLKLQVEKELKKKKKKRKELELEVGIILTKVKKCRSDDLTDLNKEQKEYLINKWKKEIREMIEAGNDQDAIIDFMCGNKKVKIKRPISRGKRLSNKIENIKYAIEEYSTDRLIKSERELETVIYEYLRHKFPQYNFEFQKRVPKGRVDIVVDDEIAIELKIADNKGNLNSLFAQIEWYMDEYDKLLIVILDLNKVPDLDDFIDRFKQKGAEVIVLTEENIRLKRPKHKTNYRRY